MKPKRTDILTAAGILSTYPGFEHVVSWLKKEAEVTQPKPKSKPKPKVKC